MVRLVVEHGGLLPRALFVSPGRIFGLERHLVVHRGQAAQQARRIAGLIKRLLQAHSSQRLQ